MNRKYNGSEEVWQSRPVTIEREQIVLTEIADLKVLHTFKETTCPVYLELFLAYLERLLRLEFECGC